MLKRTRPYRCEAAGRHARPFTGIKSSGDTLPMGLIGLCGMKAEAPFAVETVMVVKDVGVNGFT